MTSAAARIDCRAQLVPKARLGPWGQAERKISFEAGLAPSSSPAALFFLHLRIGFFDRHKRARFGLRVVEDRKLRLRQRPPPAPQGRRAAGRAQRAHDRAAVHGGGGGLGDDHVKIAPADLVERGLTGFHGRGLVAVFDQQVKQPPGQRAVVLRSRIFMAWPPLLPA